MLSASFTLSIILATSVILSTMTEAQLTLEPPAKAAAWSLNRAQPSEEEDRMEFLNVQHKVVANQTYETDDRAPPKEVDLPFRVDVKPVSSDKGAPVDSAPRELTEEGASVGKDRSGVVDSAEVNDLNDGSERATFPPLAKHNPPVDGVARSQPVVNKNISIREEERKYVESKKMSDSKERRKNAANQTQVSASLISVLLLTSGVAVCLFFKGFIYL